MALVTLNRRPGRPGRGDLAGSAVLGTGVTATGGGNHVNADGLLARVVEVVNGATNNVIFNVEVSPDGTTWYTALQRVGANAFALTAITVAGSTSALVHVSAYDALPYVRVNVGTANANGTTFTLHAAQGTP